MTPPSLPPAGMSHTHALRVRQGKRAQEDAQVIALLRNAGELNRCGNQVDLFLQCSASVSALIHLLLMIIPVWLFSIRNLVRSPVADDYTFVAFLHETRR